MLGVVTIVADEWLWCRLVVSKGLPKLKLDALVMCCLFGPFPNTSELSSVFSSIERRTLEFSPRLVVTRMLVVTGMT